MRSTFIHLNRWSSKYKEHIPYTRIFLSLWAFELYITGDFLTQSTGFYMIEPPWIQLIPPLINKIPWSRNNCDIYSGGAAG